VINSKRKGKYGELDAAECLFLETGIRLRRSSQYKASESSPDLEGFEQWYVEVKRRERLNVHSELFRAMELAGKKIPILIHRPNRKPWMITFLLKDARAIARAIADSQLPSESCPETPTD